MSHLPLLGAEVFDVRRLRRDFDRHELDDCESVAFQPDDLPRIVREQADFLHAEIAQNLRADAVVSEVFLETELKVRLDGVQPLVLQRVRLYLVREPDAPALRDRGSPRRCPAPGPAARTPLS